MSLNVSSGIEYVECKPKRPVRLRWDRADTSWYQHVVASHLANIAIPADALLCNKACAVHFGILEKYYSDIIQCLFLSAKLCIPEVKVGVENTGGLLI